MQKLRIVGVRNRQTGQLHNGEWKKTKNDEDFFVTRALLNHGTKRVGPITVPNNILVSLSAFGSDVELLAAVEVGKDYLVDGEWDERPYTTDDGRRGSQLRCIVRDLQMPQEVEPVAPAAPMLQRVG